MSWWSGLASRAEDLLNRVDQTAATALGQSESGGAEDIFSGELPSWRPRSQGTDSQNPSLSVGAGQQPWYYGGPSQKPKSQRPQSPSQTQLARSATSPTRLKKSDNEDAALFDFLNSSEPVKQKERPRSALSLKSSHSRKSSDSSIKSDVVNDYQVLDTDTNRGQRSMRVNEITLSDDERNGQKGSESFYASLKNDFSKSEIKKSRSMTSTPVVEDDYHNQGEDSPSVMSGEEEPIFIVADPQRGESSDPPPQDPIVEPVPVTEVESDGAVRPVMDYVDPVLEDDGWSEGASVTVDLSPPVVEVEQSQFSEPTQIQTQEIQQNYAPPDVMTTSFQNPYADPEPEPAPSIQQEPEIEPEPEVVPRQDGELEAFIQKVSSLELENKLLRSEVASLNEEMVAVVQREKQTQYELSELASQSEVMMQLEAALREHQSRECDYTESLKAKDHQIGVLRVRLEELDNEMAGKNQAIQLLESERERILRDHSDTSSSQSEALEGMRCKLSETENSLRREQDAYRQVQREHMERQTRMEDDQRNLTEQLQVLHKKLLDEKSIIEKSRRKENCHPVPRSQHTDSLF